SCASASRTASAMVSCRSATACSGINVHGHLFGAGVWRLECEGDALRDLGAHLLFEAVERGGVDSAFRNERLSEDLHRVALLTPLPLLVLGPVVGAIDVADVVPALPVGVEHQKRGASPCARLLDGGLGRGMNASHILAVGLVERDAESRRPQGNVARGGLEIVRVLVV